MKNPWMKKNPFLSMWLSGANSVAGTARGKASSAIKRQSSAVVTQASKDVFDWWSSGLGGAQPKRTRKRR